MPSRVAGSVPSASARDPWCMGVVGECDYALSE